MATTTARQRILALIQQRGGASASQIGHALGMSAAAVRHHLSILARDGRIVAGRVAAKGKRGRPEKAYRLSDRLLGENLGELSDVLLSVWLGEMAPHGREGVLRAVGKALGERAGIVDARHPAAKRLVQLTEKLNKAGYQARWEAGARGPRILLGHCPYAAIIDDHPELCRIDAAFLQTLSGEELEQLAKMDFTPGGATQCVFATGARIAGLGPRGGRDAAE